MTAGSRDMAPQSFLLPEFDHEMSVTRRLLERLPDDSLEWRPHDRSFSLAELATHIALLPQWGRSILDRDGYDLDASDGARPAAASRAEIIESFDRRVADVREVLAGMVGAELETPWTLMRGTQVLMSMPRYAAVRRFLLDHMIHHRGQLTVYLRLRDIPLPPIYGPSADEGL